MFYSHEFLTDRKHGVATIWLMATLGSRSNLRKISRRAILGVDVPEACNTITDSNAPMALRLQGSLLYGVSRVFAQQCGYTLSDTQGLRDKMRGVSMLMKDLQIDQTVNLTTNEQLNLPIDPAFDIDLSLGLDLSTFDISTKYTDGSSILSPARVASSQSSLTYDNSLKSQPRIPFIEATSSGEFGFDFGSDAIASSGIRTAQNLAPMDLLEGPAIDSDRFYEVSNEGELIDRFSSEQAFSDILQPLPAGSLATDTVADTLDAVRKSLIGHQVSNHLDENDLAVDDEELLTSAPTREFHSSPPLILSSSEAVVKEVSNKRAEAPQTRSRPARVLQVDRNTELRNRDLSEWNDNYTLTMTQAKFEKNSKQSTAQARRNAAFWVLDQGIGGVSINFSGDRQPHPFSAFSGVALLDSLAGRTSSTASRKRSHSALETFSDQARSTRSRNNSHNGTGLVVGQHGVVDDDEAMLHNEDDIEVEMGRQPDSSLREFPSSSMPWNIAASSRQGSVQESIHRAIGSSTAKKPHSFLSGRRSHLMSASPLMGRGETSPHLSSFGIQGGYGSSEGDDEELNASPEGLGLVSADDFELYGPAAEVDTQEAAQSQWLIATLEKEAYNFLLFLDTQIQTRKREDSSRFDITFEELLPPAQNSSIVAAQGLLHVLSLVGANLIHVKQDRAFGQIYLSIPSLVDNVAQDQHNASNADEHMTMTDTGDVTR